LLKNAGLAPEWIAIGREIDMERGRLQAALARNREVSPDPGAGVAAALDRKTSDFNLRVPHACLQKPWFRD